MDVEIARNTFNSLSVNPLQSSGLAVELEQLTRLNRISQLILSPDGTKIAHIFNRKELHVIDLTKAATDTSRPLVLGSHLSDLQTPAWSPDSQALLFVAQSQPGSRAYGIYKVKLNQNGASQPVQLLAPSDPAYRRSGVSLPKDVRYYANGTAAFLTHREEKNQACLTTSTLADAGQRSAEIWSVGASDNDWQARLKNIDQQRYSLAFLDWGDWDICSKTGAIVFAGLKPSPFHRQVNEDIYLLEAGASEPKTVSSSAGRDHHPRLSPDGRWLVIGSRQQAGSGNWDFDRLLAYDLNQPASGQGYVSQTISGAEIQLPGNTGPALPNADLFNPQSWFFLSDGRLIFTYRLAGESFVCVLALENYSENDSATHPQCILRTERTINSFSACYQRATNQIVLAFSADGFFQTAEIFTVNYSTGPVKTDQDLIQLTRHNFCPELLSPNKLPVDVLHWIFKGAKDDDVEMFIACPRVVIETALNAINSGQEPAQHWPLIHLLHGGPHLAWLPQFHGRFNSVALAAKGYIVAQVNFHGSSGHPHGEAFSRSILDNGPELPRQDIEKATLFIVNHLPVDTRQIGLIGGSYGAYLGAWLMGHPQTADIFAGAALHAGVYDLTTLYGEDDYWIRRVQFDSTPWQDTEQKLKKLSPVQAETVFKAPCLLTHGDKDPRIPYHNSILLHRKLIDSNTALPDHQAPSSLIIYPGMGHTLDHRLLPWWDTVLNWFKTECGIAPGPVSGASANAQSAALNALKNEHSNITLSAPGRCIIH